MNFNEIGNNINEIFKFYFSKKEKFTIKQRSNGIKNEMNKIINKVYLSDKENAMKYINKRKKEDNKLNASKNARCSWK